MKEIVCICEGISYELLNKYLEEGSLPNIKRLVSEGNFGELQCNEIPYEASCLTTALSGVSVKEHGIISYWNAKSYEYIPVEWNSEDIKQYMFWNKDEYKNNRYALINLFGTQPTYEIDGYMLSYSMDKNLRYSYPKDLLNKLNKKRLPYVQDTCAFFNPKTDLKQFCLDVLRIDQLRKNVFINLLQDNIDVGIVNFTAIDRLSHFSFHEVYQKESKDTYLYQAYKQCDEFIGELMEFADKKSAKFILFSEIGFGALLKFVRINDYLCQTNFMKRNDVGEEIQWKETLAFETVQGSHGVNINLKTAFRDGCVSIDEYDDVIRDVMDNLKKMRNPHCDQPMFSDVIRGRDYSDSKYIPDILVVPYDWRYLPYGDAYWANHVSRDCQTGWHRANSFWATLDKQAEEFPIKSLQDIAEYIKANAI